MPKNSPEPATEPAGPERADARPTLVALTDKADKAQLRFLAREVRLRNGHYAAIKSGVAQVRLRASAKEIAVWGGRGDDERSAMISAEGYRKCNTVAQITVLTPPSLEIPGLGKMANPYVTFSKETEAFKAGWIRKIAVAPGPTGNVVLTDRTTYLSLVEYLMEDLIGVAKRHPTAVCWGVREKDPGSLLADFVAEHNSDLEARAKEEGKNWLLKYRVEKTDVDRAVSRVRKGLWGFYPVEPITGQGLWFDRTAEAVATVFRSYAQTGKFGLRKLEAIAYRNVLRDHPLMPGMSLSAEDLHDETVEVDGRGGRKETIVKDVWVDVPVFFHEQVEDEQAVKDLLREFESGMRTAAFTEVDPQAAKRPERVDVATAESEKADEDRREEKRPDPTETERLQEDVDDLLNRQPVKPDPHVGLLAEIKTAEEILGSRSYEPILAKHADVKRDRLKASKAALEAYYREICNLINRKNAT